MKRDLGTLSSTELDVLVVGGGIVGACVAWDAASRGLRVGLVEREDFGGGASANCFKIIHGGLRYLQHLDLPRMRESIRERSTWLRLAPHLVEPLPFVMPTYRRAGLLRVRPVLAAALRINDIISADRNVGLLPERRLPAGRVLSRAECLDAVPQLDPAGLTGGILFHDGQLYSPERLVLEVVQAAASHGATIANYVAFEGPLLRRGLLAGAALRDVTTGARFEARARVVVNATGAAVPEVAARLAGGSAHRIAYSLALNLMVPSTGHSAAFAVAGGARTPTGRPRAGGRQLFFTPWRGRTLIGTAHYPVPPGRPEPSRDEAAARFLAEAAEAFPALGLARDDVLRVHAGRLPVAGPATAGSVRLLARHRILDHGLDGVPGAISVVSVKYTTARQVAQEVVDLVSARLGRTTSCSTATSPLPGSTRSLVSLGAEADRRYGRLLAPEVLEHLVRCYGRRYERVAERSRSRGGAAKVVPGAPVIAAQLEHAVAEEMAVRPEDLLERRTELGPRGLATRDAWEMAVRRVGRGELGTGLPALSVQPLER